LNIPADFAGSLRKRFGYHYGRRSFDKLLKDIAPELENPRLQAIRLFAEPLAHADYTRAIKLIDDYLARFDKSRKVTKQPVPSILIRGAKDDDGSPLEVSHSLTSSEKNLITEEFAVFERQGYSKIASEILAEGIDLFRADNVRLGELVAVVEIQRALKFGIKKKEMVVNE